jgi:hypothetical protein
MNPPRIIHVIFKTHLDIGYTDFARNVTANYINHFIPAALDLADEMRWRGTQDRFVWTTGSWLIDEFLRTAAPEARARMEAALRAGDIVWHGLPCTLHTELSDAELLRFALSISKDLDRRFGRETVAAKMTDVPGHTRALVPLLAEAGIRFLHIGVNGATPPPEVPPVFRWADAGGAEVMVMYHKGYGDLMLVDGLDEGIYFAHTNDNMGPQTPEQVSAIFAGLRARFPGAEVRASTMDDFARALESVRTSLPVLQSEIGDTWIHGDATDPTKVAQLRALMRLRREWLANGRIRREDELYKGFNRGMMLVTEHTWGLDEKVHLADYENYSAERFQAARSGAAFRKMEESWQEQRAYLTQAVDALADTGLQAEARTALAEVQPVRPNLEDGWERADPYLPYGNDRFLIGFNDLGALAYLEDRVERRTWAGPERTLGQLRYQTFSQGDYEAFYQRYIINKRETASWALDDFTKPGMDTAGAVSRTWLPKLDKLYAREREGELQFLLYLLFPSEAVERYGAPGVAWVEVVPPQERAELRMTLQWFDKAACRLPEALWFSFNPAAASRGWEIEKAGRWIDPLDVVRSGNRHLHGCGEGVRWRGKRGWIDIHNQDAALVAPGQRSLLDFNNYLPRLNEGMHFLLYDNLWGTNFPMWFEDDMKFRFSFEFGKISDRS